MRIARIFACFFVIKIARREITVVFPGNTPQSFVQFLRMRHTEEKRRDKLWGDMLPPLNKRLKLGLLSQGT